MNLKIQLALRYLSNKGRRKKSRINLKSKLLRFNLFDFLSFSNLIAFLGIVIGLFSLIIVSSVMSGLSRDMTERIISTKGEMRIFNKDFSPIKNYNTFIDSLSENSSIKVSGPVNHDEFLIRRRNFSAYTETFGIDYHKHKEISDVLNMIRIGQPTYESFIDNGIILGLDVSFQLNATVGDTIEIVSPSILIPTALGMIPKTKRFKVIGIFSSGLPEFDRLYSFIDIENSKEFKKNPLQGIDYIELKTNLIKKDFKKLTQEIETQFPQYTVQHWEIFDKSLFQAVKVEKYAMFVVMTIILVLASFNIAGNFIRTVSEKKEEIALLKTIGMNKKDIFSFFMTMGLIIGISGVIIANILAFSLLFLQNYYQFVKIPIPGFPFTAIPVDLSIARFVYLSLLAIFICVVGTIYPAYKTIKINIIEVLHEEQQH
ncbi:MAG: ABC transporter permease [Candidatus Cloacimonetes bacterium]|jgi:lipoprotein-releasing system permease protein|nr:ABC transporter permease [Candidatus Cloacimonadota bacterium]MDD4155583.1 ABC transporter permease [Candidatus Cloacimonadota bacterium]